MKVLLCVLVAVCAARANLVGVTNPVTVLEGLVEVQKKSVQLVVDDLTFHETEVRRRVETEVNKMKAKYMLGIEEVVESSIDRVRDVVDEADRIAKKCYQSAKTALAALAQNGHAALGTCVKNSLNLLEEPYADVADTIQTGRRIMVDLDSIIPDCYSPILFKMRNCVMARLLVTRTPVTKLQQDSKSVKKTVVLSSIAALSGGRSCMKQEVMRVHTGATEVEVNAATCARNVQPLH